MLKAKWIVNKHLKPTAIISLKRQTKRQSKAKWIVNKNPNKSKINKLLKPRSIAIIHQRQRKGETQSKINSQETSGTIHHLSIPLKAFCKMEDMNENFFEVSSFVSQSFNFRQAQSLSRET